MPDLQPFEQIDAGGVDSRSNPLNMPRNRALRCLNWVPKQAGFWELRWGYNTVSMSSVTASALTGLFPYRTWDGHKYVLFIQGTTFNVLDTATGIVTTPPVRGANVVSSVKGAGFLGNNRFHYGNGTDQKWFDSATWRDSGLRAPTTAEMANVVVTDGTRELTATEASTITLTAASGGSFPADTLTGHLIYVAFFDTATGANETGPATIFVGSGRVKVALNQKITVANLPVPAQSSWVKLIGGTLDGGNLAYFFVNTQSNITSVTAAGQILTVKSTAHGMSTGDIAAIFGTGNPTFDGIYQVTVSDANTFTVRVTLQIVSGANTGAVGTVTRIVSAGNATTSVDVTLPVQNLNYQVNQNRGLPASVITGPTGGYQFFASIYNPNGGGHVGNRVSIGGRYSPGASYSPLAPAHCNFHIAGLPSYQSIDTEWAILIGRTGDGAQVPYVCTDNASNWLSVQAGLTSQIASQPITDGNHELPTRNGIIPSQCNMFCLAGDYAYAADTGSPFLRRSGSFADDRAGIFTGRPEQSWAPDDIVTFPTAEPITGMFETDQEVLCGTLHDCAIDVNLAGIDQWTGPWNIGIAGRRAGTKCGAHGFYWLSGDKELCTLQLGVPVVVSEEYELSELAQIGDAFLSTVELVYFRSGPLGKDELRIEAQKSDGTPYTIIHDFKLIEYFTPPGSVYGQGYSSQFSGPLGTVFTSSSIRDSTGALRIYAGASNGQIYQLYTGPDDAGSQYNADAILLINGGPNRLDVPYIDYYGDANIDITLGRNLQTSLAAGAPWGFVAPNEDQESADIVQGAENDFLYRVYFSPPEVQRLYLRFQLLSHPPPPTYILADSNNVLWQLSMSDGGILQQIQVASGTPQTLFISDANGNTFQITVTTGGILKATLQPPAPGVQQSILFTTPNASLGTLTINNGVLSATVAPGGGLALNNPPHLPLENYGRLYEFVPSIGDPRGR